MKWNRFDRSSRRRNLVSALRKNLSIERLEERLVLQGDPRNLPPVNVVPDSQSIMQGSLIVFQSATGNRFSVRDPDAGSSLLEVKLSASKGLLSLTKPRAVRFVQGDGLSDTIMVFRGTQAKINEALSTVIYTSPATYVGSAVLTITTNDLGSSRPGGAKSDTDAVTVNIASILSAATANLNKAVSKSGTSSSGGAINRAPSFIKGLNQTVLEDSGPRTVAAWATGISRGPANESTQTLSFLVSNNNTALFSSQPNIAPNGTLTYTPAANANGSAVVTVKLKDNGGTANGGQDTSAAQSFTITVSPVNDAPSFTKGLDQTVLRNSGPKTIAAWATAISRGPANESTQTVSFLVSNNNAALFKAQPSIAANGTLTYTPAVNASGSATVTVKLKDNGGTANGGQDTSASQTFTISVTPGNTAPSFIKGPNQTVLEDSGPKTVTAWATVISPGPANEATQTVSFLVSNNNTPLFSAQPSIAPNGTLTFTPAVNANGSAVVTVKLKDNGGTANGGQDTSAAQSFTITVNPVNDAPSFIKGPNQTILEDSGPKTVTAWATGISRGPANESTQTLSFLVSNNNTALFSSQPSIALNGTLTYTPAANANGSAVVTVKLKDNGGTANGGQDTSAAQSFTITVNPINDAPSFIKGPNQTILEDSGPKTVTAWATGVSHGSANESDQTLSFLVSNNNTALFSAQPSIASNGTLTYTPAANANGLAVITVKLKDNAQTANGGQDTSAAQSFTITVSPVNDAPSFVKGRDLSVPISSATQTISTWATSISTGAPNESSQKLTFVAVPDKPWLFESLPKISENGALTFKPARGATGTTTVGVVLKDDGGAKVGGRDVSLPQFFTISIGSQVNVAPSFAKGPNQTVLEDSGSQTVAAWATGISPGPAIESTQTVSFLVSNNNTALFSVQPSIAANGTLAYTPAPNANGSAIVTVQAKDSGGTASGGIDTSAAQSFTITVTPVNDAPSFTKGANQTVLEDSGAQTVAAWATAISPGPAIESTQTVSFLVSNNNTALFSVQPSIAANGTLAYTPAPNANGSAIVTVQAKDSGGTASGGIDTSAAQSFTITVTPVNDAPSFTKGANQTVLEDSGAQTVAAWATGISPGPAIESTQTVSFLVSNNNTALFSTQPSIAANGTLNYTPAPNANGSAIVTVQAKDSGGTASGGVDTSAAQSFTITVTPVNDAPSFTVGPDQTISNSSSPQTVAAWATGISSGPANESSQTVSFLVSNNNTALFSAQPTIEPNGTLTYTPAANANGSAIVTVQAKDSGGTASGGVDTSVAQTFTISLSSSVDSPAIFAELLRDTAPDNQTDGDAVTFDPRITGSVFSSVSLQSLTASVDGGTPIAVSLNADGSFVFDPPLARDGSSDGNHVVRLLARDSLGNQGSLDISFTLDTRAPTISSLSLSAASGFVSPQTSNAGRVTLLGTTAPGRTVKLLESGATALANSDGEFQFLSLPLTAGDNLFTAVTSDQAGNARQVPTVIRRVSETTGQDPVLRWNQAMLEAVQRDASAPTFASRGMAMVHTAIYDAVSAIEQKTGYYVSLAAPAGASLEAAVTAAAHRVLSYLYPGQQTLFDATRTASLAQVPDGPAETSGLSFGQSVGDAVIALRASDGWNDFVEYVPGTDPGDWRTTEPLFAVALDPHWADLTPFSGANLDVLAPSGPPSLSSLQWANAFNETKSLGRFDSQARTADQTQIARFWANGPGTVTPPGHWNMIAQQVALAAGNSVAENARLFAMLSVSLADAAIVAWQAKYQTDFWRPITAIQSAESDNNELTTADAAWQPLLITPNFPEYVSGHSTFSSAAATVLTSAFGQNYSFSTSSPGLPGVSRSFASFDAAAAEAGRSRIYGGIHYEFSNQDGLVTGKNLAEQVLKSFTSSTDELAPKVVFSSTAGAVSATNQTIVGRVLDNLSGVKTLTAAVDGGTAVPVAFDALGNFTFATTFSLTGGADGAHRVSFVAEDFQGNISSDQPFDFTLDTRIPALTLTDPVSGQQLVAGDVLSGVANGTGSAIVELKYSFNGQPARTIPFNSTTSEFNEPLNFAALPTGATTLSVLARDAAGLTTTVTRNLTVVSRAPFSIEKFTPLDGAKDVGSTYRPQVFFSRAVNPATLSANNFYATGPNGAKLAANIVPAGDGSFAWLFFTQPMPGASQITVHIDGATILAAGDGAPLDADDNGTAGGELTYKFSTVSLTPLMGTTLSGKVVEAGPDLKPMTYDDVRVGPDQVLHTADDVFLTPLAGVKVFIVGLESQFVLTDAQGNFSFASAPAGNVKLAIDGRTATNAPSGTFFPEMVMDLNLEAGRANTVMGTMGTREQQIANRDRQEVYLPRLQSSILKNVSGAAPTVINVDASAAPNITAQQRSQLTLEVQPGSMRDQNGNLVPAGQVGISTVPPELVREMLPPGLLQHTFDITVQAPGVTNFATPAPMSFPNTFGAKPGEQLNFLSFDHTTGRLVIEGTATVSADGLSVRTDPGTGITHPGWHGVTPPLSPTRPDNDQRVADLGTEFNFNISQTFISDVQLPQNLVSARSLLSEPSNSVTGVQDYLFTSNGQRINFKVQNSTDPKKADGSFLRVQIDVDPNTSEKVLDGLRFQVKDFYPGQSQVFDFGFKPQVIKDQTGDSLIGAKYKVQAWKVSAIGAIISPVWSSGDIYLYRYVDASDNFPAGGVIEFTNTINDGPGGVMQDRIVGYYGDPLAQPTLSVRSNFESAFSTTNTPGAYSSIFFDPRMFKDNQAAQIAVNTPSTPGSNSRLVTNPAYLVAIGNGIRPQTVYLNKPQFIQSFTELVKGETPVVVTAKYKASLYNQNPRPTFSFTFPGVTTGLTERIQLGEPAEIVESVINNFFGNLVEYRVTHSVTATGEGSAKVVTDSYSITPVNGSPSFGGRKTPAIKLVPTNPKLGITSTATDVVPIGRLTTDQKAYLNEEGALDRIFTGVVEGLNQHYQGVRPALQFSEDAAPNETDYDVDWVLAKPPRNGVVAEFEGDVLKAVYDFISTKASKLNSAQVAFGVAQVLSKTRMMPSLSKGTVYIQELFKNGAVAIANISKDQLVALISKTLAHELGHGFGLPHTAYPNQLGYQSALQKIDVLAGSTSFQLSYAGSPPVTLPANALPSQVKNALLSLAGLERADFSVTGSVGGPYFVDFDVSSPKVPSLFKGSKVPLLVGFNAAISEIRPGRVDVSFANEVVIGSAHGRDDIMRGTVSLDESSFLPSITLPVLQMGLGNGLTDAFSRNLTSFYTQALLVQKLFAKQSRSILPANFTEDLPESDPEGVEIDGSALALFNSEGELADQQPMDFGKVQPATPVTKTLSLVNLGGIPVVIRGVGITRGFDRFSVPQIPVTTLQPGESLPIPVTFNSILNLNSTGFLVVDSDIGVIGGTVDLVGTGEVTNTPAIRLDYYGNQGPVRVGQATSFAVSSLLPTLTNVGSAPLTITEIRVAAGQGFGEWMTTPLAQPITLAPGQSTGIPMSFRPSKVGLRPGAFEVLSNDPRTPLLRIPVVATGVISRNFDLPEATIYDGADLGNDYVVVSDSLGGADNLPDLRTRSDDAGNWEFFLPANTGVAFTTYDPVSGLISRSWNITNASGVPTTVWPANFVPSNSPDTDGDGLPDDVEFAIGTNPNELDTDADGMNDFAEIDTGLNPLDDRPTANGIVSALQTGVTALDIKLAADFRDPSRSLAYIASGNSGLTVVDVTDFARPITIAQLAMPGAVNNVSLDVVRKLVAASSPTGGVHLIDVADPSRPTLVRTLPHEGSDPVAAVELYDGLVYLGVGGKIRSFDIQSGESNDDLSIAGQRFKGMGRGGDRLYVTTQDTTSNQFSVRVLDITATGLVARGVLAVPNVTTLGDPYFTNDIERLKDFIIQTPAGPIVETRRIRSDVVWIPAGDRVVTVDVSNAASPEIITSTATIAQGGAADIELNGSGLAVVAGVVNPGGSAIVLRTPVANNTNQIFTRFTLPSFGEAIALSSGLAYIADGASGLQLLNFLQRDTGLTPPTVDLDALLGDINPAQLGLQLYEGSTITIGNRISDDVQVRKVELLVDGTVVRTELSYPYDLTTILPTRAQSGNQAVLQVRATDSGGNSTLSDPIVIDLVADTTAPAISTIDPANGSTQPISRRKVTIKFSEALDRTTVVPSNFVLQGPGGPVNPISVDLRQRDTQLVILYPPLAQGAYTFVTRAALVKDRAGNAIGATDISSTFSVAAAEFVPTIRWVNDAGGQWNVASNWIDVTTNAARVPTATDDVLIDVPTDALITFGTGLVTVNSILSNERFAQTGGTLTVIDTMQVNNTFTLGVNQLFSNNIPTFKGTILRGTGGQGLSLLGESRLDTATIQTDITTAQANTQVRLTGGLALTGTFTSPTAANTNVQIGLEGSQTISSGTFVTSEAANNAGVIQFMSLNAGNTITFGQDVTLQGQIRVLSGGYYNPPFGVTTTLNVINYGTMKVGGQPNTSNFGIVLSTTANTFVNHGLLESQGTGTLVLNAKSFTNSATGRIKIESPTFTGTLESLGAGGSTTSFVNAGTIELINSAAQIMSRPDGVNETWSNTGTIIVDKGSLSLYGSFTSDDLVNLRNAGGVAIQGQMVNTGRTFTFTEQSGRIALGLGTIKGGTLVMGGPNARLDLVGGSTTSFDGSYLDGVTLRGDLEIGGLRTDPVSGISFVYTYNYVRIRNGLTLDGTITIPADLGTRVEFVGAQTVSGGTFRFTPRPSSGGYGASGLYAQRGGPVVLDSSVTIRTQAGGEFSPAGGSLTGNFISNASIIINAYAGITMSGIQHATAPISIINRGTITVPALGTLTVSRPFANEGQVNVSGGTLNVSDPSNNLVDPFLNTGTINLAGGGRLNLSTSKSDGRVTFRTAELGTIISSGGFVVIGGSGNVITVIDNGGATLVIDGTAQWSLSGGVIVGGTIQIDSTARLEVRGGGVLKDVDINGNVSSPQSSPEGAHLAGEVDLNGTFNAPRILQFGHPTLYPGTPLILRSGVFIVGEDSGIRTLTGYSTVSSIMLEPAAVLRGRRVDATFESPLTNRGQIIAEQQFPSLGYVFHFTVAPITNEGTLSAVNRAVLRIANLAAPNSGVVAATSGSAVQFTGAFAQSAAGTTRIEVGGEAIGLGGGNFTKRFGEITAGAGATLAGKLEVNFVSGFTPTVGSRYQVLNYASRAGTFDSINVTGLAAGLVVTPEYNGTNMTLVVSAAAAPAFVRTQSSTSSSGAPSNFAPTVEPIVAVSSEARSLSITKMPTLSYPDSAQISAGHQTAISSRADYVSSGNRQSSTELRFTDDNYYAAIDEVFKNLEDELRSKF